ncbi:uncharacterized protein EDB91DRAFT_1336470, partial [Suillus paluster]|uniref:uncharacterized protein n=1 Tax=Suillus paluster TaxID=48578 RepID=UPI001B86684B
MASSLFLFDDDALNISVSAHQPAGSYFDLVPMALSDESNTNIPLDDYLLATPSFEKTVADDSAWHTRVLHAPQPRHPLIYQWCHDSPYAYSLMNNQMDVSRSSAPSPILAMQDNLLENFRNVCDYPRPPVPPHNRSGRFHPYHPHEYHSTYFCQWDNEGRLCNHELQATPKDVLAHLREHHRIGVDNKESCRCLWATPHGLCEKQLKIQSFGRHVITHIGIRIKCWSVALRWLEMTAPPSIVSSTRVALKPASLLFQVAMLSRFYDHVHLSFAMWRMVCRMSYMI